jgi:hypothetical protein
LSEYIMPNEQLEQLLSLAQAGKRVCPVPQKWNELWELLPQRKRVGAGWEPPLPLILGAWWHTSDAEKQSRFLSHIRWAADHGALGTVSAFINSLEPEHWHCTE